jgi:hypothetical protein
MVAPRNLDQLIMGQETPSVGSREYGITVQTGDDIYG